MHRILERFILTLVVGAILCGVVPVSLCAKANDLADMEFQLPLRVKDDMQSGTQENQTQKQDTVPKKPKKPLESYFFDDSTRKEDLFLWTLDMSRNKINKNTIDTAVRRLNVDYPFLKNGVGDAYLGQLGGPTLPYSYVLRPQYSDFSFASAFNSYYFTPENAPYYNVKKVFTRLDYFYSGQVKFLEENFGIIHAQNISPSSGFNVNYRSQGARGIYKWQKARDKNLSLAFSHTGEKYTIHAGYIYNMVDINENGGVADDRFVTDTIFELPRTIPIRLDSMSAKNKIRNNIFYLIHSYGVPLKKLTDEDFSIADRTTFFVGHAFEYHRWHKTYSDTRVTKNGEYVDNKYYENWYLNPISTNDSIFESRLSNRLFVQLQPFNRDGIVGLIDAGAGVDLHHFYMFTPSQMITGDLDGENKTSYYVYASTEGKLKRYFNWGGDIKFHPAGYRSGDMKIGANASISAFVKKKPITLQGRFVYDLKNPTYWMQNYVSNHYVWSNSFAKENESRLELTLLAPEWGVEAGVWQNIVSNKIYFDQNSLPAQSTQSVSITGAYLQKDFALSGFHLNNRVLLQWSTHHEIAPVPLASAFLSWFYSFDVVKEILRLEVGLNGRYNTEYYAPGYNPAIAQFYNQREKEIGNYPMVDVFLNAKWKRMRILVKYQHLNENLFGSKRYFDVPHYPLALPVLKLGVSWAFYD